MWRNSEQEWQRRVPLTRSMSSQCGRRRNRLQAGGGAQWSACLASGKLWDEEEEGAAWGGRRKIKGRARGRGRGEGEAEKEEEEGEVRRGRRRRRDPKVTESRGEVGERGEKEEEGGQ